MKKTYITPTVDIDRIDLIEMVCTSNMPVGGGLGTAGDFGESKNVFEDIWDQYDYDEE